jgi:hypothetical protein
LVDKCLGQSHGRHRRRDPLSVHLSTSGRVIPHHFTLGSQRYYAYDERNPLSPSEFTHYEWLAKRLLLKQNCIIVELGPYRSYKEFSIKEIPATSTLLISLGQRELCDRHIWFKELDAAMFHKYWYLPIVGEMGTRGEMIHLMITARELSDGEVKGRALAALSMKAEAGQFDADHMFSREDVDWVYEHTQSADAIRTVIVPLAFRSEGLVVRLKGPAEFLAEVAVHLEELEIERRTEFAKGIQSLYHKARSPGTGTLVIPSCHDPTSSL